MNRLTRSAGVFGIAVAMALSGCAAAEPIAERDQRALAVLAEVAGPTSGVDAATITETECWLPSAHPVSPAEGGSAGQWRVLCRVHYSEGSAARYRDTTCIGDFDLEPMLESCYRWTPYSDEPRFEDFPHAVEH